MVARFQLSLFLLWILLSVNLVAFGQVSPPADDADVVAAKAVADKFLELVLNRPQPGTALLKSVEFYQSIGRLDELIQDLKSKAKDLEPDQPEVAARYWLTVALIAQTQSRWLESIEVLQQVKDDPELRWSIATARALAHEQLQRWPGVVEALQEPVELAITGRSKVSSDSLLENAQRLAKAHARMGRSPEALQVWHKLESRFGGEKQIAKRLAAMAADEGELKFAIEVLDRILATLPPSTERIELGIQRTALLARTGEELAAQASYQQLLKGLSSDSWLAQDIARRLEDLIINREGPVGLIAYYRQQLQAHPDQVHLMLRLAALLDSERRWDESDPLYKSLLQRTSQSLEPHLAYAQSFIHQGKWPEAVSQLEKAAQLAPRNEDVIQRWCEAILADDSVASSERHLRIQTILEKQLEGTAGTPANYQKLARHLQRFGLSERAADWLDKAYQLQPDDFAIVSEYARALFAVGRRVQLQKVLTEHEARHSQAQSATSRDALAQLADLHVDLDNRDQAIVCLQKACSSSPTTTLRFRLAERLVDASRQAEAIQQLELAWAEIPAQTKLASEQEALCEEVVRRHLLLLTQAKRLTQTIAQLMSSMRQVAQPGQSTQPPLAELAPESVVAWRLSKCLIANHQADQASPYILKALTLNPKSVMLWRLRAEVDEQAGRYAETVEARRKLAELDVRKRSEHLLVAAKTLARMGRVDAALQLTESITTETASSQNIIAVFDLAVEHEATKFALDLLQRRLQARPGDLEVLQRLIAHHVNMGANTSAVNLQWQVLELMDTADQRNAAVQTLIDMHDQLKTLPALEERLEKFWRQHDLWREFGVWQALIALKRQDIQQAESLLKRLTQSPTTRQFAVTQLLKLAQSQGQGAQQFQWIKQLATIDPQQVHPPDVSKILIGLPAEERSPQIADDVLKMVRGAGKRLALLQDLLDAGSTDWFLRIVDALPTDEQEAWPVVVRTALAWSSVQPSGEPAAAYVQNAQVLIQRFGERSLNVAAEIESEILLKYLLDVDQVALEAAANRIQLCELPNEPLPGGILQRCQSVVQAYEIVVLMELQAADTPVRRRDVIERHRQAALAQVSARERAIRLSALSIVSEWGSRMPTFLELMNLNRKSKSSNRISETNSSHIKQGLISKLAPNDKTITGYLGEYSQAFLLSLPSLDSQAAQGDQLATLLCLWSMTAEQRDQPKTDDAFIERTLRYTQNLGAYAAYAPARLLSLLALSKLKSDPDRAKETMRLLSRLPMSRLEQSFLLQKILGQHDHQLIEAWISHHEDLPALVDVLGELLLNRTTSLELDPSTVWRSLDLVWQAEVRQGLRKRSELKPMATGTGFMWVSKLPKLSLVVHETSVFHAADVFCIRAVLARISSNSRRQELLRTIQQLCKEASNKEASNKEASNKEASNKEASNKEASNGDLRLVRYLAYMLVLEMLEQDAEAARALDEILPPAESARVPGELALRGMWLDMLGQQDAAIQWCLQNPQWPAELQETMAAMLLRVGFKQHHDGALHLAAQRLAELKIPLNKYVPWVGQLIERRLFEDAELLLGDFAVLMPPNEHNLAATMAGMQLGKVDSLLLERWQQTDLLFTLLQQYSQTDQTAAAFRVGRRLISAVNHASDQEFQGHMSFMVHRLTKAFKNQDQLVRFLQSESQEIQQAQNHRSDREVLCLLRLMASAGLGELTTPLLKRFTSGQIKAIEAMELAQCQLQLGQDTEAGRFFAQAFTLEPDWLETGIGQLQSSRVAIRLLAEELNKAPQAGNGVGDTTLTCFLSHLSDDQLSRCKELLWSWAENSRPKSVANLTELLQRLRRADFTAWLGLVERLLQSDELSPMVVAYRDLDHWALRDSHASALEDVFFAVAMDNDEGAAYDEMLDRVLSKYPDHFLARLLQVVRLETLQQFDAAGEKLPRLIQSSLTQPKTKRWHWESWQAQYSKTQSNMPANAQLPNVRLPNTQSANAQSANIQPPNRLPNVRQPVSITSQAITIDQAAKARLLRRVLHLWETSASQIAQRVVLMERLADLEGIPGLTPSQQNELFESYLNGRDGKKVLWLFASGLGIHAPAARGSATGSLTPMQLRASNAGQELVSTDQHYAALDQHGMHWEHYLIETRRLQLAARISTQPPSVDPSQSDRSATFAPIPSVVHSEEFVKRLLREGDEAVRMADNDVSRLVTWSECFKPKIGLQYKQIRFVSMLDFVWPSSSPLPPETKELVNVHLAEHTTGLLGLGPWQTLWLHNLAVRVGNGTLVKRTQEHLIALAEGQARKNDVAWRIACWSAYQSSGGIDAVKDSRLAIGELARTAIGNEGLEWNAIYDVMSQAQLAHLKSRPYEFNLAPTEDARPSRITPRASRSIESVTAEVIRHRVSVNMQIFESMMQQSHYKQATELLITMRQNGWIAGSGQDVISKAEEGFSDGLDRYNVVDSLQRLIDNKWEPQQLQGFLEALLLPQPVRTLPKPPTVGGNGSAIEDLASTEAAEARTAEPHKSIAWDEPVDVQQPVPARQLGRSLVGQLIEVSRLNNAVPALKAKLKRNASRQPIEVLCQALLAVEQGDVDTALAEYHQLLTKQNARIGAQDLTLLRDSIFNAVRLEPLSPAAIRYSVASLDWPINVESIQLIRQQFALAVSQQAMHLVNDLSQKLDQSTVLHEFVRERLRLEYAIGLLDSDLFVASFEAYAKFNRDWTKAPAEPDDYILKLMNRIYQLDEPAGELLFNDFQSSSHLDFPWLTCFAMPVIHPLPENFLQAPSTDGLVQQAVSRKQAWIGLLSWIAEHAKRTGRQLDAINTATGSGHVWPAAALTALLDPQLSAGALKLRLAQDPTPTHEEMLAVLDCCRDKKELREAAVEVILNLGFADVALASTNPVGEPGRRWKHWLTFSESFHQQPESMRPKWSLSGSGQWTAAASTNPWYLMLRYPVAGDFNLGVSAQQISESKYGIGCGGISISQHKNNPSLARCLGVGGRRGADLIVIESAAKTEVSLKIQRQGTSWTLQAGSAVFEDQAHDTVPFLYLVNHGAGVARLDNWQLSQELKIARQANLIDSQLRLWQVTHGSWKLPLLRPKVLGEVASRSDLCGVEDGVLRLPAPTRVLATLDNSEPSRVDRAAADRAAADRTAINPTATNQATFAQASLHCLRALEPGESLTYEFYSAADEATVHPMLGRLVWRLDGPQVQVQWLTSPKESRWLDRDSSRVMPLAASEVLQPIQIQTNAWNKIQLQMDDQRRVTLTLNESVIARVVLPTQVRGEIGLSVVGSLPAKVRKVELSGPWPERLSLDQLKE